MRSTLLLLVCFIAATATLTTAAPAKRDVSEIAATIEPEENYLPPTEANNVDSETQGATIKEATDDQEAAATLLSANGYEYKTVRKLRYRNRRDVSHLNLGYLPPPASIKSKPTLNYLPPVADVAPSTSSTTTTTTTVAPPPLAKLSNEYLPPVQEQYAPLLIIADTEAPEVSTEAAESTTTAAPEATDAPAANEATALPTEEVPEETAVFADDGYHYKRPQVIPDLTLPGPRFAAALPLEREYLPPLEAGVVVAEGPGEETSVLADDGYHIRAIRRLRY